MHKKRILIGIGLVLVVSALSAFAFLRASSSQAKLDIRTNVQATVFLNGDQVGTTPYEGYLKPGEVTVRLVPTKAETPLAPWSTKLSLVDGVTTVVRRDFDSSEPASAGEVLSFEKTGEPEAELSIVSVPDAASVSLDGQSKGYTPLRVSQLAVGEHQITVSHPGYKERSIPQVTTIPGYKLTVVALLAQEEQKEQEKKADTVLPKRTMVQILSTPTGFLRVRSQASTAATESAKVKPGEKFLYIEENDNGNWFKIEYEAGKQGWVSSQYTKKVEEEGTVSQ